MSNNKIQEFLNKNTITDTPIYVVFFDENPVFYTSNIEQAREHMLKMANYIQANYFIDFLTYLNQTINLDELTISLKPKNIIPSYEKIFHKFYIKEIPEFLT